MSVSRHLLTRIVSSETPDAELIALGQELDTLFAQVVGPEALLAEREAVWRAAGHSYALIRKNRARFWRSRHKFGVDAAAIERNKLLDRIDAVHARIRPIEPRTFAGLAVKAQTTRGYARRLWEESEADLDYDQLLIRRFVDEVYELGQRSH